MKIIRPVKRETFNIDDANLRFIFQLRVGLSPLKAHKKRHNFSDTPDDTCQCLTNSESTIHFLLKCPLYNEARNELINSISAILLSNGLDLSNNELLSSIILYGHDSLSYFENRTILTSTIYYICQTGRFI